MAGYTGLFLRNDKNWYKSKRKNFLDIDNTLYFTTEVVFELRKASNNFIKLNAYSLESSTLTIPDAKKTYRIHRRRFGARMCAKSSEVPGNTLQKVFS